MILRHGGQLYLVGQTEERIDLVKELRDADDLVLDLLGSEEDMRVVLSEAADAEHTVQRTGELVAMDKAELAEAQRQLLIGVRLELIDQNAAGAVHGLDGKVLAVDDGGIHIVLIVIPVTGGLPQGAAHDLRGLYLDILPLLVYLAPVVDQGVFEHHALGQVEREAGGLVAEGEQAELAAELAVVAALGFLDAGEVLVKLVLLRESDAVDTLEGLTAGVAAPVSGIAGGELDGVALDATGGIQMRACAEIGELALTVEADDGILGQVVDKLDLIGLVLLFHELYSLGAGQLEALELELLLAYFAHLGFDLLHYLRGEGEGRIHIVVEAVLDSRADSKLYLGVEALDSLSQNMGAGVPIGVAVLRIFKAELVFVFVHDLVLHYKYHLPGKTKKHPRRSAKGARKARFHLDF